MERKDLISLGFEDTYPIENISMSYTQKENNSNAYLYLEGPIENPLKRISVELNMRNLVKIKDQKELDEAYEDAIKALYKIKEAHLQLLKKNQSQSSSSSSSHSSSESDKYPNIIS